MVRVRLLTGIAGTDDCGRDYSFEPGEEADLPDVWADGIRAELSETTTVVPGQHEPAEATTDAPLSETTTNTPGQHEPTETTDARVSELARTTVPTPHPRRRRQGGR